jgi:hypothetical protein
MHNIADPAIRAGVAAAIERTRAPAIREDSRADLNLVCAGMPRCWKPKSEGWEVSARLRFRTRVWVWSRWIGPSKHVNILAHSGQ